MVKQWLIYSKLLDSVPHPPRVWFCAMLRLNMWSASRHTLIHSAQAQEEDTQEEHEGEGQEQQDEAGKSTMQK